MKKLYMLVLVSVMSLCGFNAFASEDNTSSQQDLVVDKYLDAYVAESGKTMAWDDIDQKYKEITTIIDPNVAFIVSCSSRDGKKTCTCPAGSFCWSTATKCGCDVVKE